MAAGCWSKRMRTNGGAAGLVLCVLPVAVAARRRRGDARVVSRGPGKVISIAPLAPDNLPSSEPEPSSQGFGLVKRFLSARSCTCSTRRRRRRSRGRVGRCGRTTTCWHLMVQLKCFNRMGYFPRLDDVPEAVVAHIRRDLGLGEDVAAVYDSDRTRGHHRMLIRRRSEVVSDIQQDRRRHHREVGRAQGLRPCHRRRPSRLTSCASVRQPAQLVCQGFGDGTDAVV